MNLAFFVGAEGGKFIDNGNWIPSHGNDDELIEVDIVKAFPSSDPDDREMYMEMPKPPGSTSRLTKSRCLRSTSAEEGYHYHLARCVPENARGRATERTMTLKTNYFDFR